MILDNYNTTKYSDLLEPSDDFLGEAAELTAITVDALNEMNNLTLAMARFEHKCLVESTSEYLKEEAEKSYFQTFKDFIVKWWNKFTAWLGSVWTNLKAVFGKRRDWLAANKSKIASVNAAQLKDVKVKIGANVLKPHGYAALAQASVKASATAIEKAAAITTIPEAKSYKDSIREKLINVLGAGGISSTETLSNGLNKNFIGAESEIELTPAIVSNLIKTAEDSYEALDKLQAAKSIANSAVTAAQGAVKMDATGGKDLVNARVIAIKDAGPVVQGIITAYFSVIGTANSQSISALVKAAAATKNEGEADKKRGLENNKPQDAKQESVGILDAYM
jgi:hypothetical protein